MREGMAGPLTDGQRRQLGPTVHGSGEHLLALIGDPPLDLSRRIESGPHGRT